MPKIVLLMDNPVIPTGYASTCRLTAKELAKRGWEVYSTSFNGGQQGAPDGGIFEFNGIKVIPNEALSREPNAIYGDVPFIEKIHREIAPDAYLFHNDSYRYAYAAGLPDEILSRSAFWLPFEGQETDKQGLGIFGRFKVIRFVTQYALDMHSEHLKGKDIGSIYHAVDMEHMVPQGNKREAKANKSLGVEDKFVVSRVDRHQPRKYWDLTLKAFAKFAKDKDDVFLICKCNPRDITMYDEEKKSGLDLEALAKDLGIGDKVHFDDYFFDVSYLPSAFYHPADVFLTTTSGEGFGLALVEAMACGVPVIYPDTPALPEVVGDGGIKFDLVGREWHEPMKVWHNIPDADGATDALEMAYGDWKSDGEQLRNIGDKGKQVAEGRYSPKVIYDEWDRTLRKMSADRKLASIVTVLYNVAGEEQIYGDEGANRLYETMDANVKCDYEWIIVDNGSPARATTREWMEKVAAQDDRIKPIYVDANRGYAGGNNVGIAAATGEFVVLLNPDSEAIPPDKHGLEKDFVELMADRMRSDPGLGILGMETHHRDDIMLGLSFPYFCCVMMSRACLDAVELRREEWLDNRFWPAYYEDADLCIRVRAAGFRVDHDGGLPCWHKSGGTNRHLIEKKPTEPEIRPFMATIEKIKKEGLMEFDFERKMGEVTSGGMGGLINGNIAFLNSKWGISARQKVRVVWHTHIGAAVGFSEIAEGLIPELHALGFDVYVNDWSNGTNVSDPVVKELIEKTKKAKESGDDLYDAVHIVCWLMETFADVNGMFKVGISFCESTKIRDSYLHLCNGMDSIMTFSEFCKTVQKSSGFTSPINVAIPGVDPVYLQYHDRAVPPDVSNAERNGPCPCGSGHKFKKCCIGKKFTFLSVGVAQERKDTKRLVEVFCEAFPKSPNNPPGCKHLACNQIELVLKSNNFGELDWVEGYKQIANIRTVFTGWHEKADEKDLSKNEMYDLYCQSHVLVHPSHGEGIGMPILEAAATGMPVIFTNWSSPAEYLDESNSYPCPLDPAAGKAFTQAYPGAPGDNGVWGNIDIKRLKELMHKVVRDYDEAKVKGRKAHEDITRRLNWKESARDLWPVIMGWHERKKTKPKAEDEFNPLTFVKPSMDAVGPGDRVMIDITTRDRRPYLACLLTSLLSQTYKNWDVSIQVDDADEGILEDHLVRSLLSRIEHEGHMWRMNRGMRQGPHMSHQRNLQAVVDSGSGHKLICRIDDDIYVRPNFLEKLIEPFLQDKACEIGAVGGVYIDPRRTDAEQMAPANFRDDIDYAGKIEPNVPWPYTCRYPEGTKPRSVEHLYSSFMYRTEIAVAIGGYCKLFSQIGHREESDFSYRFCLAGYKLLIHPDAIGYHFYAPSSGIRSIDINEKDALAETDHKIYMKRLARWKAQLQEKRDREAQRVQEIAEENAAKEPRASGWSSTCGLHRESPGSGKVACIVNGEKDLGSIVEAVERFAPISDSIYVMCGIEDVNSVTDGIRAPGVASKVKMVGGSLREMAQVFNAAWSSGSEFVMTVSDQMRFQSDPRAMLSRNYDEYVFEVYNTYERGHSNGSEFEADASAPEVIGPECRNMCLISRSHGNDKVPMERRLYSDTVVIDDQRTTRGPQNKSAMGNPLLRVDEMGAADWTKVCIFQHPDGKCDPPKTARVSNGSPLVSIIIPTPGRKEYLKQCIDSIYSLTSTSFELIMIDNDSSDGTAEMLAEQQKMRPGIQVYRQSTNLGYQKSINIAVEKAKGKYLLLFNDDAWVDKPEPDGRDWLKVLIDELESDPKIGLVGPHDGESPALKKPMLFFWCVMLRRSTWDEIGPLDDVTFLNYGGDDDYCERLRMAGYEIRQKYVHLRHLMNLVPPEVKNAELAESRLKLLNKYSVGV